MAIVIFYVTRREGRGLWLVDSFSQRHCDLGELNADWVALQWVQAMIVSPVGTINICVCDIWVDWGGTFRRSSG